MIGTRVTPQKNEKRLKVFWVMATDKSLRNVVAKGFAGTNSERDFTIKVDVTGLSPATTYYYAFYYRGKKSIIGRTRTTPKKAEADQLRFAVVSCSNYQAGYFNAYARIAERKDLDAVIHLGDYIYEYASGAGTYGFDSSRLDRSHIPDAEILELIDYRTRYSLYRLDADLIAAHQQHPFIPVWDDHESANDAYKDGAENHNEGEGLWEDRKSISKKVWFEWMPVRETADESIYRTISYGNLADLIMVDTRLEGREIQPTSILDTVEYKTLLGEEQRDWLVNELTTSDAKWKIIGNQVIFSQLNVGFAATDENGAPALTNPNAITAVESIFVDIWDGYPKERRFLINAIEENKIDNVVILTGDFHSTFAFDVTNTPVVYPNPFAGNLPTPSPSYDGATGAGSVAIEFATPSVTSANFDENVGPDLSAAFELSFNNPIAAIGGLNYNPHMKYVDLDQHGYFVLDIKENAAQADWYFVNILDKDDEAETFGQGWYSMDTENLLQRAKGKSTEKEIQPDLAPNGLINAIEEDADNLVVFSAYPNPVRKGGVLYLNMALLSPSEVKISLMDFFRTRKVDLLSEDLSAGNYTFSLDVPVVRRGIYLLQTETSDGEKVVKKIVIR
ncbi:MAG: alkaline phosphatase D family protein [Bacteroidota bacterium]